MPFFDSQRDPVDNSIVDTFYWKSTSSTGSSTTIFDDLTIPSSPNFPNSTATRYMINLPGEPYYAGIDAGNSTFIVKNVNTTTFLTRVAYNGTLSANTYKIFPSQSNTPARLEAHVGVGSNSAGDVLAYHGRFVTSIISSSNANDIDNNYNVGVNYYSTVTYISYNSSECIKVKSNSYLFDIGAWNMVAYEGKTVRVFLNNSTNNRYLFNCYITDDNENKVFPINYSPTTTYTIKGEVNLITSASTVIYFNLDGGSSTSFFATAAPPLYFVSTSINRGFCELKIISEDI